ncbi:MAG: exopolysaccharide biosynthesis protein [Acidimicrobiales bacterium]|nr:exopolysaccharide biosynthesis protein [Acidimicrobiales bacterium]
MSAAGYRPIERAVDDEPALREYVGVISRRRRVVAGFVALVTLTALGSSLLQAKRYTADARVLIQPRQSSEEIAGANAPVVVDRKRIIDTEVRVMSSESVRSRVEERFGAGTPPVTVMPVEGTDLVSVSVTSTDPALAQAVANATATEYARYRKATKQADLRGGSKALQDELVVLAKQIDSLQARIDGTSGAEAATLKVQQDTARARYTVVRQQADALTLSASLSTGDANLVDPAALPTAPVTPQPLRSVLLALVASSVLGVGLAFLVDLVDDRIESKEDVERLVAGRPVLGLIPFREPVGSKSPNRVAAMDEPEGAMAQAYRSLRTSLQFMGTEHDLRTIQVTSAVPEEGKSTTAANLAAMFAMAGKVTVLVDADLRRPTIHRFFDLTNKKGLTSALLREDGADGLLRKVDGVPGLHVITSGPEESFPAELMQSSRATELIETLAQQADVVIFDSPPVLSVADPLVLASKVDAVLLVASVTGTTRRQVSRATELLDQAGAKVCGTVLNHVRNSDMTVYGSYSAAGDDRSRLDRFFRPAGV